MTTARRYLSIDIETAQPAARDRHDLGVTCIAYAWRDGESTRSGVWYADGAQMTQAQAAYAVRRLQDATAKGFTLLGHNSCSFDLRVLAHASGEWAACAALALAHVDMCFALHCFLGYPVGLDALAKGMGLPGKSEGITGADAPQMWADGRRAEVMDYCRQDAATTLDLALACELDGHVRWRSKSGKAMQHRVGPRWPTVAECRSIPLPNVGWLKEPVDRESFTGWLARVSP